MATMHMINLTKLEEHNPLRLAMVAMVPVLGIVGTSVAVGQTDGSSVELASFECPPWALQQQQQSC